MTTHLRFLNKCTFRRQETVLISGISPFHKNEAGQWVPNPAYATAGGNSYEDIVVPCTFLYLATNRKESPAQENEDIIEFVIGDTLEPLYSDHILNIKDRWGDVIEDGPLEVIGIKKYVGYRGRLHHYRVRTRRMKDC